MTAAASPHFNQSRPRLNLAVAAACVRYYTLKVDRCRRAPFDSCRRCDDARAMVKFLQVEIDRNINRRTFWSG